MLTGRFRKAVGILAMVVLLLVIPLRAGASEKESTCYGTPVRGRLENGWQLPGSGRNFQAYSTLGAVAGRNYTHSRIYRTVLDAYEILEKTAPGKVFVYGETGWNRGGRFRPHKTHQNGLSVDFFVPVVDSAGTSVPLPTGISDKFGYDIEFDRHGRFKDYTLDFDAMAEHLSAIRQAADANGVRILRVIFDNDLQALLFKTRKGSALQNNLPFSVKKPWVRHDEHYHIDFSVPCKPLTGK
jgi:penicillin-insensitive murein endopeptidase